jgi:hypothetical protein
MNRPELPFEVVEAEGGRLIARWKVADSTWREPLSRGSVAVDCTLTMALDDRSGTVRAVRTTRRRRMATGPLGLLGLFSWTRSVGGYGYESAAEYGFVATDDGFRPARAYRYRCVPAEITQPVAGIVSYHGWRFKPVYTLFRPLGG